MGRTLPPALPCLTRDAPAEPLGRRWKGKRFTPQSGFCCVGHDYLQIYIYIYFFFFLASNFPICWRNSPLGTSKVQPGAAGPAPRLPRPEEGYVGQSCPETPCCPRGAFSSPETKLLEKHVATRALQEILSRSDAFGASANAACFPSCLFLKDCFSCVPKVPGC